jgi:hypothetical protein
MRAVQGMFMSLMYAGELWARSRCVPMAETRAFSITITRSARSMVVRLCAEMRVVLPFIRV